MGCGIEPRKEEFCGGRDARNRRRQHVRHRYARCRRSAGVEGHITSERNVSEPERSHVRPQAAEPTGPHREGEEPKPMMHGHEKSDSAIVATKPPNKAGRPAAEAVERRAEAKENANRCRTGRTQCRESLPPPRLWPRVGLGGSIVPEAPVVNSVGRLLKPEHIVRPVAMINRMPCLRWSGRVRERKDQYAFLIRARRFSRCTLPYYGILSFGSAAPRLSYRSARR